MLVWFRIKRVVGATEAGSNFEPVIEQFDFILQIKVGTYGFGIGKIGATADCRCRRTGSQVVADTFIVVIGIGFISLKTIGQFMAGFAEIEAGGQLDVSLIKILAVVGMSGRVVVLVCSCIGIPAAVEKRSFLRRIGKTPCQVIDCGRNGRPSRVPVRCGIGFSFLP